MKDAVEFGLKSFFAGCLGCLGACTLLLVGFLVVGLIFQPQLQNMQESFTQSLQDIIPQGGPPGSASPPTGQQGDGMKQPENQQPGTDQGESPPHPVIYLTRGENPQGEWIDSFPRAEAGNIYIWVQNPPGITAEFKLMVTIPDGEQVQFGPVYSTDPDGNPINCGHLSSENLPTGTFKIQILPTDGSQPLAGTQFMVTE